MKVLIIRVKEAKVEINNNLVSKINKGLLLLVGFCEGDNSLIIDKMTDKILSLRIFEDENGLTNLSIRNVFGDILSVSQFTLYADTKKGNRPSFINALKPEFSKPLFEYFNNSLERKYYKHIECGVFGADMKVFSINDGPFTILLDSKEFKL